MQTALRATGLQSAGRPQGPRPQRGCVSVRACTNSSDLAAFKEQHSLALATFLASSVVAVASAAPAFADEPLAAVVDAPTTDVSIAAVEAMDEGLETVASVVAPALEALESLVAAVASPEEPGPTAAAPEAAAPAAAAAEVAAPEPVPELAAAVETADALPAAVVEAVAEPEPVAAAEPAEAALAVEAEAEDVAPAVAAETRAEVTVVSEAEQAVEASATEGTEVAAETPAEVAVVESVLEEEAEAPALAAAAEAAEAPAAPAPEVAEMPVEVAVPEAVAEAVEAAPVAVEAAAAPAEEAAAQVSAAAASTGDVGSSALEGVQALLAGATAVTNGEGPSAETLTYVGLGAAAASFVATFFVAPRFREEFKEPVDWKEMYAALTTKGIKTVTADEAYAKAKKGAVLLDVRLADKYDSRHAVPSVNAPLYQPIAGWDPASNVRRAGFAFFGIFGTELNENFVSEVQAKVPKNKEVLVMCETGGSLDNKPGTQFGFQSRSLKAIYYLQQAGFTKIIHVKGGLSDWQRAGLPLSDGRQQSEPQQPAATARGRANGTSSGSIRGTANGTSAGSSSSSGTRAGTGKATTSAKATTRELASASTRGRR